MFCKAMRSGGNLPIRSRPCSKGSSKQVRSDLYAKVELLLRLLGRDVNKSSIPSPALSLYLLHFQPFLPNSVDVWKIRDPCGGEVSAQAGVTGDADTRHGEYGSCIEQRHSTTHAPQHDPRKVKCIFLLPGWFSRKVRKGTYAYARPITILLDDTKQQWIRQPFSSFCG